MTIKINLCKGKLLAAVGVICASYYFSKKYNNSIKEFKEEKKRILDEDYYKEEIKKYTILNNKLDAQERKNSYLYLTSIYDKARYSLTIIDVNKWLKELDGLIDILVMEDIDAIKAVLMLYEEKKAKENQILEREHEIRMVRCENEAEVNKAKYMANAIGSVASAIVTKGEN